MTMNAPYNKSMFLNYCKIEILGSKETNTLMESNVKFGVEEKSSKTRRDIDD